MRRATSIGIAIGADTIRIVALVNAHIADSLECRCDSTRDLRDSLGAGLDDVLRRLPRRRRRTAAATVGPSAAQVRLVPRGSEPVDHRTLAASLEENAARYFVAAEGALVIAPPAIQSDGAVWVAAFESEVVDTIVEACRARNLDLVAIAPTVATLHAATMELEMQWADGQIMAEVAFAGNGDLRAIRRRMLQEGSEWRASQPIQMLAVLGDDAWRFADAFAAALSAGSSPALALSGQTLASGRARTRANLRFAMAACATGFLIAAISPGLAARRTAAAAERELGLLEGRRAAAAREYRAVVKTTNAIAAVNRAVSGRRSMTLAVAALTRAIPDSAFLTDLRLDTADGTVVALGPHAAAIVGQLATASEFGGPALVGAVTPQLGAVATLERATIRFRWAARPR